MLWLHIYRNPECWGKADCREPGWRREASRFPCFQKTELGVSLVDEPGLLSSEKQERWELLSGLTGGLHCPCEDLALTHKCQGPGEKLNWR